MAQTNGASMKRALLALSIGLLSTQAHAHHRHHHARHHASHSVHGRAAHERQSPVAAHFSTARPSDCYGIPWCGCWLKHYLGIEHARLNLNLARAWANIGSYLSGPVPGAVVVFPHHVGLLVRPGRAGRWVVLSGNDGHRVRERERSVAGAIAFRRPA